MATKTKKTTKKTTTTKKTAATKAKKKAPAKKAKVTKKAPVKKTTKKKPAAKPAPKPEKKAPALVDKSAKLKESGKVHLFPGAPKACFGARYRAGKDTPCDGGAKRGKPCRHREDCMALLTERAKLGVRSKDDHRIPADYDVSRWATEGVLEKYEAFGNGKEQPVAAPVLEGEIVATQDVPSAVFELVPAVETTITEEELAMADARIADIERNMLDNKIHGYVALGKEYRIVFKQMRRVEFTGWLNRKGYDRNKVMQQMRLANAVDKLGDEAVRVKLLEAPGMTPDKFDVILNTFDTPDGIDQVLTAKAPDKHGAAKSVTEYALPTFRKHVKSIANQEAGRPRMTKLAEEAAKRQKAKADKGKAGKKPTTTESTTPDPFFPMPFANQLAAIKRGWVAHRADIDTNLAALSQADLRVLRAHREFAAMLVEDFDRILAKFEPKKNKKK